MNADKENVRLKRNMLNRHDLLRYLVGLVEAILKYLRGLFY